MVIKLKDFYEISKGIKPMIDYEEQLNRAAHFISEHDSFLIVSHVNPDGDTIASSLALAGMLQQLGKKFELVNQDEIPQKFYYLPMSDQIKLIDHVNRTFSSVISVDVADRSRMGEIDSLIEANASLLNIDHHPTNDLFGDENLVLASAAATAEVMFDLLQHMGITMNQQIATCIYTGLLTDTGGFRYSNTTPKVMRIAAELLEYGISPGHIAEIALETITQEHIQLLRIALSKLEIIEHGALAWTTLLKEDLRSDGYTQEDTEGIVNYCRNIEGVEIGVFFKESEEQVLKVSLRSKKQIDVGSIAKQFGGGGHARAAGYTFKGSIEEAKMQLLHRIKEDKGWNEFVK